MGFFDKARLVDRKCVGFELCDVGLNGEDYEDLSGNIKKWPSDMGTSGWLHLKEDGVLQPMNKRDPDLAIPRGTVRLHMYSHDTDIFFNSDVSLEDFKRLFDCFGWKLGLVGDGE